MTYKEALTQAMTDLARDPRRVFVGYNVRYGSKANGTLAHVPESQLLETPVAENLMMGLAIGLALEGFKPVVWYERFDFVLNASDAIVNHLDKLKMISRGEYAPAVIIRANVGSSTKPLFTGVTHTQDFTKAFRALVSFKVAPLRDVPQIQAEYAAAGASGESSMFVEYRDLYEQ
jgi:pyruvate/2-oxoglutarate/acetoin dehydrogenase E1 component